ncbi:MAG: acyltransferase [Solirubrobacterales bacterium]
MELPRTIGKSAALRKTAAGCADAVLSSTGRQCWIEVLRTFSCFAIVMLHVASLHFGYHKVSSASWWVCNVFDASTRFAVPVFLMISGALLLDPQRTETLSAFYRKRMSRLLAPCLFWIAFYMALNVVQNTRAFTVQSLGRDLLTGQVYYHLWYLFILPGLYLVTPFLRSFLREASSREVLWLAFVIYGFSLCEKILRRGLFGSEQETVFTMFVPFISYYILGSWLTRRRQDSLGSRRWAIAIPALIAAIVLAVGTLAYWFPSRESVYCLPYSHLSPLTLAYSVAVFIVFSCSDGLARRTIDSIGRYAFMIAPATLGIYLIHPFLLYVLHTLLPGRWFATLPAVSIPVFSVVIFVAAFFIVHSVQKVPYVRSIVGGTRG